MLKKLTLTIFLVLLCTFSLVAQEAQESPKDLKAGIVYGKGIAFGIRAPEGWVLDVESGRSVGMPAVFYPKGSSWENGASVMYASSVHKDLENKETIETVIENDLKDFRADSPEVKMSDAGTLPTKTEKHNAVVKYFSGSRGDRYEAVAYIDEKRTVVMLVLSSKAEKEFKDSLRAFKEIIASYQFIGPFIQLERDQ